MAFGSRPRPSGSRVNLRPTRRGTLFHSVENFFPHCGKWAGALLAALLCATPAPAQTNPFHAPLYWSVYENLFRKEQAGQPEPYITEAEWLANINWVEANLKPFGYDMVCVDGWGDVSRLNQNGYRLTHSRHWEHDYAWWAAYLRERGLAMGMYGNPLWVHVNDDDTERRIVGTDILVASLKDPAEDARFPWVQVERPGAEQYVKGWIHFYADMGIRFFRIDFLSWYEDGQDRWLGRVGPARPRAHYETALRWMREAADERGMLLSFVMPHLNHDAAAERRYGHMMRVNEDTGEGGWNKWSEWFRGQKREGWSVYGNAADGLAYWSRFAGRGRIILDPDFIRLNTFATDDEKRSVIAQCLLAGAPIAVADQHDTIGDNLRFYTNNELLELNRDGFVGQPLSWDPTQEESQIWFGQLSGGDWVIGLFNRENEPWSRRLNFAALGLAGVVSVRDLWTHEDLGEMESFAAEIPPHGCRVLRLSPPQE